VRPVPDTHTEAADADGQASGNHSGPASPRVLCDIRAVSTRIPAPAGAVWKLAERGRQLDANLIRLSSRQHVGTHIEPDLDVLILVLAGDGTLGATDGTLHLTSGILAWLPRGSARSLTAGKDGLTYLTVHQRRPGMQIRSPHHVPAPPPSGSAQ
jgi:quercetin dioxygenase-like cupin family protein